MKKLNFSFIYVITLVVALVVSTSCSKKMDPLTSDLFTATPAPLELVGSKVPATINGRFPAKWFDKKATVIVTPVLKFAGGEALGRSQTYQGEKVTGNGIVINRENGGAVTLKTEFNYIPAMQKSELFLRFAISRNGGSIIDFPDVKVADGVVATAALADPKTVTPALAPDAFQRIIKEAHDAEILFLIQQAELRSSELNSSNLAAWKELIKEADANDRKNVDIEVSAYASPDGGFKLNEKLAERREKNTSTYLEKELKKNEIDTEVNAKYTAQDWDGFQKLVQASSLQDKDLVLRVLSMYPDPERREQEIKNISAVYSDLAETILPKLRRSRLTANVEIIGKTDKELADAVNNNEELTIEEILYAATLNDVSPEKAYTLATQKYPNDYRGWNNLGNVYYAKGDFKKAEQAYNKANQVSGRAPQANMNLALINMLEGNNEKAEQLLGNAAGANTLNEALGVLYIKQGDYAKAVQAFGETKSNNAALAQILTKNYNKAQQTLNGISAKDATTYYLLATVAAKTNNVSGVAGNLKSALDKGFDKSAILNDIDFAKFLSNSDIANMLR
ncbi:tetratricopeptide repeat protein [Dysgonomonas massiliensis]|uniref:tetratricopeptide repeat protein n=1 Tax=Dysgonomonas massiliensis TaxID=2040292 RepID=UPI000C765CAB|nr:tetratricopeptide repeat protein [Dysgonomonas massiliensis]